MSASSRLTHYDPHCIDGCELRNRTIAGYLRDEPAPLETALTALPGEAPAELMTAVQPVPDKIDAETAIKNAVNGGGDTDTIGAVAGALAGTRFGANQLPDQWVQQLTGADELRRLGRELTDLKP